jgi:nitrous oxidase accessory protein NosD
MTLILALLTSLMFGVQSVKSSPRTIVVPEDYSTIQEAVSHAADGDTVLVKNGIYPMDENNTIVISKTLHLVGEDPAKTVILGASSNQYDRGVAIRLAAPNITVSGFTITDFKVAIALVNYFGEPYPLGCRIINNNIVNNSEGIRPQRNDLLISENNIAKNGVGIAGYNTENVLITRNNIIENGYGVNIGICRNITISENQVSDNTGAINLVYYGPYFVFGNKITDNSWGIRFAEACSNATVYGNNITQNGVGVVLLNFPNAGDIVVSGVGNTVFGNLFLNNTRQVAKEESNYNYPNTTRMGTDTVSWNNSVIGNYWDDYSGIDENDDGIGDTPYIMDENNKDNYPLMTPTEMSPTPTSSLAPTPTPFSSPTPKLTPTPEAEIFPTTLVIGAVVAVVVVCLGLLVYLKKRHKLRSA